MARMPFQKPKKVEWEVISEQYGRLVAEPFEKGYALTVGHSLRRTLLSIISGAAVAWIKVDGVASVDTKIPGVKESTVDVLLNLKKLAVQVPAGEPRTVTLEVTGPKEVTGADVPETDVEIINPDVHLFTLERGARVSMDLGIGLGRVIPRLGFHDLLKQLDIDPIHFGLIMIVNLLIGTLTPPFGVILFIMQDIAGFYFFCFNREM